MIELPDHDALVDFARGHPVARWNHSARRFDRAWGLGEAASFTDHGRFGHLLLAFGAPDDAVRLAAEIVAGPPAGDLDGFDIVVVPRDSPVSSIDQLKWRHDWEWFWTTTIPERRPGEAAVERLDVADPHVAGELTELLDVSSPTTSALPGDPTVDHWYGIRAAERGLVACAAESERASGSSNLRAIAVHPALRGRGLGADVTAAVMRAGFEAGLHAVTLGMYSDNETAARPMYQRLGFQLGQEFATYAVSA